MTKSPRISVIMPTFNRGKTIEKAIASVIAQDFADWELLVIDDGSTDGTSDLVRQVCLREKRIRLIRRRHRGETAARANGIKNSRGEIITFLDSDDMYKPSHLSANLRFLDKHPETDMTHSTAEIIGGRYVWDMTDSAKKIHLDDCAIYGTFFIRRHVLEKTGRLPLTKYGGDYLLLQKITASGFKTRKINTRTYIYDRTGDDCVTKLFRPAPPGQKG